MEFELLKVLGKDVASPEVRDAIQKWNLTDIQNSPPFRRYYGSQQKGLDLLADHDRVIDIQIFVQPAQGYSGFTDTLPFGILKGMNQQQVHQLLGSPAKSDEFDSKYEMPEIGARVTVSYDDSLNVKYVSIAVPKQSRK
jgi:hypothetical protein